MRCNPARSTDGADIAVNTDHIIDTACLRRGEVVAIAKPRHTGHIQAAERGEYLLRAHQGRQMMQRMTGGDLRTALHAGDLTHARVLHGTPGADIADRPDAVCGA